MKKLIDEKIIKTNLQYGKNFLFFIEKKKL